MKERGKTKETGRQFSDSFLYFFFFYFFFVLLAFSLKHIRKLRASRFVLKGH